MKKIRCVWKRFPRVFAKIFLFSRKGMGDMGGNPFFVPCGSGLPYWKLSDQDKMNLNFFGAEDIVIKESFYNDIFGMGCTLFCFFKHIHPFLDCASHNTYQVVLNTQEGNQTRLHSKFHLYN
jgi:hypothetical protein